jgi:hypothetical protein
MRLLRHRFKRFLEFAFDAGLEVMKLHADDARRLLDVFALARNRRIVRIHEHAHRRSPRRHFPQKAEPLGLYRGAEVAHPGDVPARPVEARDEAASNGIDAECRDDWNVPARSGGRASRNVAAKCDEQGHRSAGKPFRQRGQSLVMRECPAIVDRHGLAFDIAVLAQAAAKRGY